MSKQWFLSTNDVVTGPFTTDDIHSKIAAGQIVQSACYIWWKGQREWMPVTTWQESLDQILASSAHHQQQKAIWYIDVGTTPIGPLTQNEMIDNLSSLDDLGHVHLWAVGMPNWKSLFEMHDVMELLGISRREHDRAPLMGSVAINRANDEPRAFVVKAASISVAGIGLSSAKELRRGDEIALLIKNSGIPGSLHLRGEVAYVTPAGHAGVRFVQVHPETHALIHDYVKRFSTSDDSSRSVA